MYSSQDEKVGEADVIMDGSCQPYIQCDEACLHIHVFCYRGRAGHSSTVMLLRLVTRLVALPLAHFAIAKAQ